MNDWERRSIIFIRAAVVMMVLVIIENTVWNDNVQIGLIMIPCIVLNFMFLPLRLLSFCFSTPYLLGRNVALWVFWHWGLSLLGSDHEEGELSGWEGVLIFFEYLFSVENTFIFCISRLRQRRRVCQFVVISFTSSLRRFLVVINITHLMIVISFQPFILIKPSLSLNHIISTVTLWTFLQTQIFILQFTHFWNIIHPLLILIHWFWMDRIKPFWSKLKIHNLLFWSLVHFTLIIWLVIELIPSCIQWTLIYWRRLLSLFSLSLKIAPHHRIVHVSLNLLPLIRNWIWVLIF